MSAKGIKSVPNQDHFLESYTYDIPESQIAQHPRGEGKSKLLVYDRASGEITDTVFPRIHEHLPKVALLVANNSRVLPARLMGRRRTGGRAEFLLLTPFPLLQPEIEKGWSTSHAEGLLKVSGKVRSGDWIVFSDDLRMEVLKRGDFGRVQVRLHWKGDLKTIFSRDGHVPLPPYIRRSDTDRDRGDYQTAYAREEKLGSVAAPTAGFHFSEQQQKNLLEQGFGWAEVTLYVGYGTFSPIRVRNIQEHEMHREYIEITPETASRVARAKEEGRPVVAVGTTTVRALESAAALPGGFGPFQGWTDLFISPGFRFQVVDHLITNFHLPRSSLLVMISGFAGRENVLECYQHALANNYFFYSYGDGMLIL